MPSGGRGLRPTTPNTLFLAWIAGFFDGEGSLRVKHQTDRRCNPPRDYESADVRITQSNLSLLQGIQKEFGGAGSIHKQVGNQHSKKDCYNYCLSGVPALMFLDMIFEYLHPLGEKKRLAAEILDHFMGWDA